jgi:hypothetical protein
MPKSTLRRMDTPAPPPLAYRLPNPPPLFVGRRREAAELAALIKRAPVTVVYGVGGVGKTSLVLATLRRRHAAQVARTVMLGLRPSDAPGEVQLDLLRALAGRPLGADVAMRAYDADAYAARAIDLAEHTGRWVVLDDLHHADPQFVGELLARVARFARRSRWIATSRVRPDTPELAHQTLALGAMSERELDELARRARPGLPRERCARTVRASSGSPWQLLRGLGAGDERDPLSEIGDERALFEKLSLLEIALPVDALAPLGADAERIDRLARAGLVEHAPHGVRLHDVARSLVDDASAARARREVGRALASAADPAAALEGARLLAAEGDPGAAELLSARAAELIEAGLAPRLWRLVGDSSDAALRAVQLRCAGELGYPDVVARLPRPPLDDGHDALLWARAQFAIGRTREVAEIAGALVAHPSLELAFEAGMLLSRCYGLLGRPRDALAALDAATAPSPALAVVRDANRARWLLHVDAAAARALAERVRAALPDLPEGLRREAAERVGGVYVFLGRYRAATEVLPELREDHADVFLSREVMLWRLAVATIGGRLDESAALVRRVRAMPATNAQQRQYADLFDIARRIATGELAGVDQALAALLAASAAAGNAQIYHFAAVYRERLAVVLGEPASPRAWDPDIPEPVGPEAGHLAVCRMQHALRWGHELAVPALDSELVSVQVAHAIACGEAALLAGEPEAALAQVTRAAALAREHGQVVLEADAAVCRCEIAAAFDRPELTDATAELTAVAAALSSPRYTAEAQWFAAIATSAFDAAALEACAVLLDVAPAAARRARRLLGGQLPLDAVDTVVCARIEERLRTRVETATGAEAAWGAWQAGWGLDTIRKAVWLPGRWVDLAAVPLSLRILEVLADAGGAVTKDALLRLAWGDASYDPQRHDKRIQVAVHRLRKQIEDDPAAPCRVVTTPDGYELAGAFRRRVPVEAPRPSAAIRLGPDGDWLASPDGARHELGPRRALRRIVLALATRRLQQPGATLPLEALLEAGWPGERPLPEAGANRVYVALSTLRKMGLAESLERHGDGYRLDPAVPLTIEPRPTRPPPV